MSGKDTACIKKSLGQFKRHSNTKIQKVADWLKDNADIVSMADYQVKALQQKIDDMIAQVKRYETCFEDNSSHLIGEDSKLEEDKKNYDKLSDEFDEVMETDHWILGRQGSSYLALYSFNEFTWSLEQENQVQLTNNY